MTVVPGLAQKVSEQLFLYMPEGVQVGFVDPAKVKTAKSGSIWVKRVTSDLEWRSLGGTAKQTHARNKESIDIVLAAIVYREARIYSEAAAAALERMGEIVDGVNRTIEADDDLSLDGAVTWCRLASIRAEVLALESGAGAIAEITITAENRP